MNFVLTFPVFSAFFSRFSLEVIAAGDICAGWRDSRMRTSGAVLLSLRCVRSDGVAWTDVGGDDLCEHAGCASCCCCCCWLVAVFFFMLIFLLDVSAQHKPQRNMSWTWNANV